MSVNTKFPRSARWLAAAAVLAVSGICPATGRAQVAPAANSPTANPATPVGGAGLEQQLSRASAPTAGPTEPAGPNASEQLDDLQRKFRAEQNPPLYIGATRNPGNAYVGWAEQVVSVGAGDVAWGQARFDAYERALGQAEAEFVEFQGITIGSKTVAEKFNNVAGTPIPPEPTSSDLGQCEQDIKERVDKLALSLSEADLQAQLRKYGVDPATVTGKPQQANADLLRDVFWKQCVTQASQQLAGLRTLQTFEAVGSDGAWRVGVLVVQTANMGELARTIAQGRAAPQGALEPDRPIEQQVSATDQQLLMDFGVRTLIDEHGDRCIVAFGQCPINAKAAAAGPIVGGMMADAAADIAKHLAQAEVAEFANSVVDASSKTTISDSLKVDKNLNQQAEFFQACNSEFRRESKVTITGLVPVRKFHAKHPVTGQDFVGVVLMWSPTTEIQALSVGRPLPPPQVAPPVITGPANAQGQNYDKRTKDW